MTLDGRADVQICEKNLRKEVAKLADLIVGGKQGRILFDSEEQFLRVLGAAVPVQNPISTAEKAA